MREQIFSFAVANPKIATAMVISICLLLIGCLRQAGYREWLNTTLCIVSLVGFSWILAYGITFPYLSLWLSKGNTYETGCILLLIIWYLWIIYIGFDRFIG